MDVRVKLTSKHVKTGEGNVDPSRLKQSDLVIEELPGGRKFRNPGASARLVAAGVISDRVDHIMYDPRTLADTVGSDKAPPASVHPLVLQLAAPRETLHFDPASTVVGIVTCGGLCPGLNDVIRSLTLTAIHTYRVKRVIGFRYGYWGLGADGRNSAIELTGDSVHRIARHGGTMLGSSRGPQSAAEMVDTLVAFGVNVFFPIGGDGTQKGAAKLVEEIRRRGLDIAVMGIPKTIDNDLSFSHRTFGYETAVEQAVQAIRAAHAEASSHQHGVGIVKLMGRESGFIAAQACVASGQASICLVPENPVPPATLVRLVERRLAIAPYCVIVVAEGFGQDWPDILAAACGAGEKKPTGTDASGNKKLADVGLLMKDVVDGWLRTNRARYPQATVKYIDPSYMIRACPPSASDAAFCTNLSALAMHEAMAGRTNCIIAMRYNNYVLVPIQAAVSVRKVLDTRGMLWRQVREMTVGLDEDAPAHQRQELQRELCNHTAACERIKLRLAKL